MRKFLPVAWFLPLQTRVCWLHILWPCSAAGPCGNPAHGVAAVQASAAQQVDLVEEFLSHPVKALAPAVG